LKLKAEKLSWKEEAKRKAALRAVKHINDGFIVGLGSGSTIAYAFQEIGKRIKNEGLGIHGVPTSYQAFMLATRYGIPVTTLDEHPKLDLAIDGTDQIDEKLNLIKGMGGALLREKIVAAAAKQFIIVADESKMTDCLGKNQQVPMEVLPFAFATVTPKIREMKGNPFLREGTNKVGPVITDNGNFIVDADFGLIKNPKELEYKLKSIPGIIETGLFIGMADIAYIGTSTSVEIFKRK
jgi:ribose 5-phosphate isomerase A